MTHFCSILNIVWLESCFSNCGSPKLDSEKPFDVYKLLDLVSEADFACFRLLFELFVRFLSTKLWLGETKSIACLLESMFIVYSLMDLSLTCFSLNFDWFLMEVQYWLFILLSYFFPIGELCHCAGLKYANFVLVAAGLADLLEGSNIEEFGSSLSPGAITKFWFIRVLELLIGENPPDGFLGDRA